MALEVVSVHPHNDQVIEDIAVGTRSEHSHRNPALLSRDDGDIRSIAIAGTLLPLSGSLVSDLDQVRGDGTASRVWVSPTDEHLSSAFVHRGGRRDSLSRPRTGYDYFSGRVASLAPVVDGSDSETVGLARSDRVRHDVGSDSAVGCLRQDVDPSSSVVRVSHVPLELVSDDRRAASL